MDASSVQGEMEIIRGTKLIEERHVEEWRGVCHVKLSIRPLRSQLRVLTNNVDKMDDDDDDDVMITNGSPKRAYDQQAYSSRTNQEIASTDQGIVGLLVMDSVNGKWMRLFGVDFIDGRPVLEEAAPPVSVNVEEPDDDVVIILSRTAFEEVLRWRANRESGESLASNQQTIRDHNMELEGWPTPSMSEPVTPLPSSRAAFDCPICIGPFVAKVTTGCEGCTECNFCAIQLSNVQAKGHLPGSYADLPPLSQLSSRVVCACTMHISSVTRTRTTCTSKCGVVV